MIRSLRSRGLLRRTRRPKAPLPPAPDPPVPTIEIVAESAPSLNDAIRQVDVAAWIQATMPPAATAITVTPGVSSGNDNQPASPILAYSLGNPNKPTVLLQACIHGSEMMATHALVEFANRVASVSGPNAEMYAEIAAELHLAIIPCLSPAAYQPALSKFPNGTYKAPGHHQEEPWYPHQGTNPNRNYPWRWDEYADDEPLSPSYKGLAAMDLPEVQTSLDLFGQVQPIAAVDMHTYSATDLPRWGIDRNDAYGRHYKDWSSQRQHEIASLLPGTESSQMNITAAPSATGWFAQQLATDGQPVYGQIIEVGAPTESATRQQDMAGMALTMLLVMCRAWIADVADRNLP